jgi:hypothetical protein
MATSKQKKLTITVDGYDASRVEDWLDQKVGEVVAARLENKAADAIEARVQAIVDELSRERIGKVIDEVLAEGWAVTNNYGESTGKKITVRERVSGFFNGEDRYRGNSFVGDWLRQSIDRDLKKAVEEEVKTAKEKLRAMFDEAITGKFAATIREALTLK